MPRTIEFNGQVLTLTDTEVRNLSNRLVRLLRQRVWLMPKFRFERHYQNWTYHNRGHSVNLFLWVVEAVGNADLPSGTTANRLNREKQQLDRLLAPNTVIQFLDRFPRWQRDAARFARSMNIYMDRVRSGTTTTVRVLEITRDTSFLTLQVCAGLLTGGASTAATASATATLARAAATNFVINEMEHSATRLGRAMAGENVTVDETVDDVVNNAIDSTGDALLGEIVGHFIGPLTDEVSQVARREISRGNLLRGVAWEGSAEELKTIVQNTINQWIGRRPSDVRGILRACRNAGNDRATARAARDPIMQNRAFRGMLEANMQRSARRARR